MLPDDIAGMQLARRRRGFESPAKLLIRKDATEKGTLAISGLAPSAKWLKTSVRKVDAAEPAADGMPPAQPGDYVLSVQADGAPVGSHVESVTFNTGLPREPKITIPVTASVQAAVNKAPMSSSLLGMAFLRQLDSVEIHGDTLTLKWKTQGPPPRSQEPAAQTPPAASPSGSPRIA